MLIPRHARRNIERFLDGYPAIAVTGPRQSGKTTLVQAMFKDRPYVSLEDLDQQGFAESDPRRFLEQFPDGAVLDEAQRCPALFSYLQTRMDAEKRMGRWILTGSQQFGLLSGISQSLAGRVSLLPLLPFSLAELQAVEGASGKLEELLWQGLYPPIYDRKLDPAVWYANYVRTYLERDVRQMVQVRDLSTFQRFIRMCAARTGQQLNLTSLGNDCGVTSNTAKAWLSVLEASYIVHLLQPHHRNFRKRLTKSPKLYFYDTGLAAWLMGIETPGQLAIHAQRGALFETWAVSELLKRRLHGGLTSNLYYWRSRSGQEIDVLIEKGETLIPMEFKSGQTLTSDFFKPLEDWLALAGESAGRAYLVYGGDQRQSRTIAEAVPWQRISELTQVAMP